MEVDRFYIWGAILTILGYVICLMPFWWIFGTPLIVLAGVILIWRSKKSRSTKLLYTLLPIVLWFPGFWLFVYLGSDHRTPETFLIPQNFRGKIVLYYGEACGQELPKENGRLIYHIPQNGVMVIKNSFETGFIDEKYYLVDSVGKIIKKLDLLQQQDFNEAYTLQKNINEPPRNKVAIFLGGTGSSSAVDGFDPDHYKFHELYVDSWDSLRVYDNVKTDSVALKYLRGFRINRK